MSNLIGDNERTQGDKTRLWNIWSLRQRTNPGRQDLSMINLILEETTKRNRETRIQDDKYDGRKRTNTGMQPIINLIYFETTNEHNDTQIFYEKSN